ncbi:tol-pal system YbgF family protein [Elusimicrobiota bacterium]
MKKLIILFIILGSIIFSFFYFIGSGAAFMYILDNEDAEWAPRALYQLGNSFMIVQMPDRAEEIYEEYIDIYPDEEYHELVLYRFFLIAASNVRNKRAAKERGQMYLYRYPDSPRAGKVKEELALLRSF